MCKTGGGCSISARIEEQRGQFSRRRILIRSHSSILVIGWPGEGSLAFAGSGCYAPIEVKRSRLRFVGALDKGSSVVALLAHEEGVGGPWDYDADHAQRNKLIPT